MSPTRTPVTIAWALLSGAAFAAGLTVAGLEDPSVVLHAFTLDGSFDPRLPLTLLAALATKVSVMRAFGPNGRPESCANARVDRRLVLGSILFGIGWGLAGICPGPGITAALSGARHSTLFLTSFGAGIVMHHVLWHRRRGRQPSS